MGNGYCNKPARRETTGVPFFDTNFAGDLNCNCFVRFHQLGESQSLAHDTATVFHLKKGGAGEKYDLLLTKVWTLWVVD